MPVSNDNFYKPEEALHELQVQETILKTAIDVQVVLRILVDKEIVTREEVQKYREEVSNSPKYKIVLDDIKRQKVGFQAAKDNPQDYLKALFKAKMNGDIKSEKYEFNYFERYKYYLLGDIKLILLKNQYKECAFLYAISHY